MVGSAKYLVHDIETIPETEVADAWRESREYEEATRKNNGEEPFPPLACHKVISIGCMLLDSNLQVIHSGILEGGSVKGDEEAAIRKWNELAANKKMSDTLQIVDWNGRGFDVPVMQYRAFRYFIDMSWYFGLLPDQKGLKSKWSKAYRDRYGGKHLDLVELWTGFGSHRKCHLKDLAMLMGLPGKTGIDGSMVHDAWKEGRHKEIDDYCVEDVWHTGFVMMRIFLMAGKITKEKYVAAVESLLAHTAKAEGHEAFNESVNRDLLLPKT